jgi:hypothetical protein
LLWLSLGEFCLSDNILSRHGLKSFSTPFSHCLTTIDYALQADREDFAHLLDASRIISAPRGNTTVWRNIGYTCEPELYEASLRHGFEFTHHDVMGNPKHRASFERKVQRWINARESGSEVTFLYHHRWTKAPTIEPVKRKLKEFASQFARSGSRCNIILSEQQISPGVDSVMALYRDEPHFWHAIFTTPRGWGGTDPNDLWARYDDGLIGDMLARVKADMAVAA